MAQENPSWNGTAWVEKVTQAVSSWKSWPNNTENSELAPKRQNTGPTHFVKWPNNSRYLITNKQIRTVQKQDSFRSNDLNKKGLKNVTHQNSELRQPWFGSFLHILVQHHPMQQKNHDMSSGAGQIARPNRHTLEVIDLILAPSHLHHGRSWTSWRQLGHPTDQLSYCDTTKIWFQDSCIIYQIQSHFQWPSIKKYPNKSTLVAKIPDLDVDFLSLGTRCRPSHWSGGPLGDHFERLDFVLLAIPFGSEACHCS